MIEQATDFCIQSDPDSGLVEAWTARRLAYQSPSQATYRDQLGKAIQSLAPGEGLRATYISDQVTPNVDVENLLFYNVGTARFRALATQTLRFDRIQGAPPRPQIPLDFEPRHYAKYQRDARNNPFPYIQGAMMASCPPVVLKGMRDLRDKSKLARLWWSFKTDLVKTTDGIDRRSDRFVVQIRLAVPEKWQLNLAEVVKPLMDGFISALHHYEGRHLNDVTARIAMLLDRPVQEVRDLLLDDRHALLGPHAVPNPRGEGLQWSPADQFLVAGEVLRETSATPDLTVRGCFFRPSSA
jgi:hypothetical protein